MTNPTMEIAGQRMRRHFARLATGAQFAAVVDCVFDISPRRTAPAFAELCTVGDDLMFARTHGETAFRHFVGRREQISVDLLGLVTHLRLGDDERAYVQDRIDAIPARATR